jgi:hypothetical protein
MENWKKTGITYIKLKLRSKLSCQLVRSPSKLSKKAGQRSTLENRYRQAKVFSKQGQDRSKENSVVHLTLLYSQLNFKYPVQEDVKGQ